jgi:hypothetical protein
LPRSLGLLMSQILANPAADPKLPTFSPCKKLDIELELACFISKTQRDVFPCLNVTGGPVVHENQTENVIFSLINWDRASSASPMISASLSQLMRLKITFSVWFS